MAKNPPCPKCSYPLTVVTQSQGGVVTRLWCEYCDFYITPRMLKLSTIKEEAKA